MNGEGKGTLPGRQPGRDGLLQLLGKGGGGGGVGGGGGGEKRSYSSCQRVSGDGGSGGEKRVFFFS